MSEELMIVNGMDCNIEPCNTCGLFRTANNPLFMGAGPMPCDVMIILEAPTFSKAMGKTVVMSNGAQGILQKLLNEMGMPDAQDIYVSNCVHCRPPDGRAPSQKEIKCCSSITKAEIEKVRPKYVLLMGASALKGVLRKGNITQIHGQVFEENGIQYIATFHPMSIDRDPSKEQLLRADLRKFINMVTGKVQDDFELNCFIFNGRDDLDAMLHDLRCKPAIAFDLETTDLEMYGPHGHVLMLGIGDDRSQWIIPLAWTGCTWEKDIGLQTMILELLIDIVQGKTVIGHNAKFDNKWLMKHYGVRFPLTFDTMLAGHLLNETIKKGLKYQCGLFFDAPAWDIGEKEKTGHSGSFKKTAMYCAGDIYWTFKLANKYRAELNEEKNKQLRRVFLNITMPASDAFERIEANGVFVDLPKYQRTAVEIATKVAELKGKLEVFAPGMNWNSSQQVGKLFFSPTKEQLEAQLTRAMTPETYREVQDKLNNKEYGLGLTIIEKTASGKPATGEATLKQLSGQHPAVDLKLEYNKYAKLQSAFIEGWKEFIGDDSRMHPTFNIAGTETGRLSCSDPNLQQVPHDEKIRSIIFAPDGWTLVNFDYSQIELRIAAMIANEREMLRIFREGKIDIHKRTAQIITGKMDISKEERTNAKACFSGDTEVLTKKGWIAFTQYDGIEPVAQYDTKTGDISFISPVAFKSFIDQAVYSMVDRNTDLLLTDTHLLLFSSRVNRNSPTLWDKDTLLNLNGREGYFQNAGIYKHGIQLSEIDTKILAMIVSDGSFKGWNTPAIRLGFSKQRKIDRCRMLLQQGNVPFNESEGTNGRYGSVTTFTIQDIEYIARMLQYVSVDKELYWSCLDGISGRIYLEEAGNWDGNIDDWWSCSRVRFSTTVCQTADVMQAMGTLSGIRVVLNPYVHQENNKQRVYNISYRPQGKTDSRVTVDFTMQNSKETVYCVQVPTGNIVVRRNGKVSIQGNCNFGFLYGMGAHTFQEYAFINYGVRLTEEQAVDFRNKFFAAYPDLTKWHEQCRTEVRVHQQMCTMTGRVRHLIDIASHDKGTVASIERVAINNNVQSFSADIAISAVIELSNWLDPAVARIVCMVHDSIMIEIRNDVVDDLIPKIQAIMKHPKAIKDVFHIDITVPLEVDAEKELKGWGGH